MLSLSLDQACYVAVKAREFDVKEARIDLGEGSNAVDDDMTTVLEDEGSDPVEDELASFIGSLNIDAQCELVALAWLGRGDYTRDDWQDLCRQASEEHTGHTARYLLGMPMLADHIETGLDALGLSCADVQSDHL